MAWEHFTDWLEPGQIITKAQRDELLDAIEERRAASATVLESASTQAAVVGSQLETGRVALHNTYPSPYFFAPIDDLLSTICTVYAQDESSKPQWTSFNLWTAAAAEFGYTYSQWGVLKIAAEKGLSSAAYWNILRKATQLLAVRTFSIDATEDTKSTTGSAPTASGWSAAKTAYLAASELTNVVGHQGAIISSAEPGAANFVVQGTRTVATVNVPAITPFLNYSAWVFRSVYDPSYAGFIDFQPTQVNWRLGTTVFSETPVVTGDDFSDVKLVIGTGLGERGTLNFECYHDAYFGSGLDAFSIVHSGNWKENKVSMGNLLVYAKPTFTHP